jgi:hypothetical protein
MTNGIIDLTKRAITTNGDTRIGASIFKGSKYYAKGDIICMDLCATSEIHEGAACLIICILIPGKIYSVSVLKSIFYGYIRIRDLCNAELVNSLYFNIEKIILII